MEPNNNSNTYVMSDETALGFYDADGSILMTVEKVTNPSGTPALSCSVKYCIGQSLSKTDAVQKFAAKFVGKVLSATKSEFRVNQTSAVGQKVRQFLLKNKPIHPFRLRDFLISEQVIKLLNTKITKIRQIAIAYLVKNKSKFLTEGGGDEHFKKCCEHVKATEAEIQEGKAFVQQIATEIEDTMATYVETLPTIELSDDYVAGAHFGDGSFYFSLTWKPTSTGHRLRCDPTWAISGADEAYCQAFKNKFNGTIGPVDSKWQKKFMFSGIEKCFLILTYFDKVTWMPAYKREQYERWKTAVVLVHNQEHFNENGIRKLLDLTYNLAEKGGRCYTKEQYLLWGLAWVNNKTRQKRQPRGEK